MFELIVEDGSGVVGANSYADLEQADIFAETWGYEDWEVLDEERKEQLLVRASKFLDVNVRWRSEILTDTQGLLFPRKPFLDAEGRRVEGLPIDIVESVIELAIVLDQHSESDLRNVKELASQAYGQSRETYAGSYTEGVTPLVDTFRGVVQKLKRYGYGGTRINTVRLVRG